MKGGMYACIPPLHFGRRGAGRKSIGIYMVKISCGGYEIGYIYACVEGYIGMVIEMYRNIGKYI